MRWPWSLRPLPDESPYVALLAQSIENTAYALQLVKALVPQQPEITSTAPVAPDVMESPRSPSLVGDAVRAQAGGDPRLASYLWSYVARLRKDKQTDEQIVEALSKWETTEPMVDA